MVAAPSGLGNRNGLLDTVNERRYMTVHPGLFGRRQRTATARPEYSVETDAYPPLFPLKSQ